MTPRMAFYCNLISDFLDERIHPKAFERLFPYLFNRERFDAGEYEILEPLFWAVEDYVHEDDLRGDEDGLDLTALNAVASSVREAIKQTDKEA